MSIRLLADFACNLLTATVLSANTANKNIIRNINPVTQTSTTVEIFVCSKPTHGNDVSYFELHEVKQKEVKTSKIKPQISLKKSPNQI
jgi:hypothetical protein